MQMSTHHTGLAVIAVFKLLKGALLLLNAAIVGYLISQLKRHRLRARSHPSPADAQPADT